MKEKIYPKHLTPFGQFIKDKKISRRKFTRFANKLGMSVCPTSINGYCNGTKWPTIDQAYLLLKIVHRLGGTYLDILDIALPMEKRKKLETEAQKLLNEVSSDGTSFDPVRVAS